MSKVLEGYVDDGKAAPLSGVPAIVTVVGTGTVVASTATDVNGAWYFDGLPEGQEYFVNVTDIDGNAVVRGPWSGEVRDVWVRDRLAMSSTGVADLPGASRTLVAGLPLVLDPNPANGLEWSAAGLFSASGGLTQDLADTLYEPLDSAYTKAEADARYAELTDVDPFPQYLTPAEGDGRYPLKTDLDPYPSYLTQTEGDARYPLKTDLDPYPTYLTASEADALFLTPAEGDAAYSTTAHAHDAAYVNVTGDSMSGDLTLDYGAPAIVLRESDAAANRKVVKLWQDVAEFRIQGFDDSGVGGGNYLAFTRVNNNFTTMTFPGTIAASVVTASTSLSVATKPLVISPDAANILEWRANGWYAAAGAVSDIWVNTAGDTMTGDLNMTANVLPTVTNARDLGSTTLRWRKLWGVDTDLSGALAVTGTITTDGAVLAAGYSIVAQSALSIVTGGIGQMVAQDSTPMAIDVGGGIAFRGKYNVAAATSLFGGIKGGKENGTTDNLDGYLAFYTRSHASGIIERMRISSGGVLSVNSRPVIMAGCRVYHSAAQTITTGTITALAFNSERHDTDAFHDTVTTNTRLTVPAGLAGTYHIWATVDWAPVADSTWRFVGLRVNGSPQIARQSGPNVNSATFTLTQNVSCDYVLAVGDYVEVVVRHERGSNLDTSAAAPIAPEFGMQRVG